MRRRRVITMCHYNRPDYSRQVLDALRACRGISDYLILPHVEPGNHQVRALIEEIDFAECVPTFNGERFGVDLNTEVALTDGFEHADFVIHIEDDIVCAPDALLYYEWSGEQFANDSQVFSVTGYNRRAVCVPPPEIHLVRMRSWFHPWGWATWSDRWQLFRAKLHCSRGWDALLNDTFCRSGRPTHGHEVYPELSRSQNIGIHSSISTLPPEWYREHHFLEHWAGNHEVPSGSFHN